MAASGRGISKGTRAPAGSTASAQVERVKYAVSPLWPGWFDDGGGHCVCSWSIKDGVRQVKFPNSGCPVRHRERAA